MCQTMCQSLGINDEKKNVWSDPQNYANSLSVGK